MNGKKKVCVNFKTDTHKKEIVVNKYRNSLYLKEKEVDLKMTKYQMVKIRRVCILSYSDIFQKRCDVLDERIVQN